MSKNTLFEFLQANIEKFDDFEIPAKKGRELLIKAGAFSESNELSPIRSFGKAMKNIALGVLSANPFSTTENAQLFIQVYSYAEALHQANDNFFSDDDYMEDMIEKTNQLMDITRSRIKAERVSDADYEEVHIPDTFLELAAYDHVYGTSYVVILSHILSSFARLCVDHDGKVTKSEESFLLRLNERMGEAVSTTKKLLSLVATISHESPDDSRSVVDASNDSEKVTSNIDSLAQLEMMIGINSVKSEVRSLINSAKISRMRAERGLPETASIEHFVFHGNPGTGKTTVARLLASALKSIGVLEKGHLVEVDRSGLVAGFVGQTAEKTKSVAQSALGGILFIDEAYTLAKGDGDFGQEAIDTILKFMEDNRGRFVVIAAGYTDQMSDFIASNPGLRSRFGRFIEFPDYSADELFEIFEKMCKESEMQLSDKASLSVYKIFEDSCNSKGAHFGNARLARNLFQDSISNQADRLISLEDMERADLQTLESEDIEFRTRVDF